MFMLPHRIRMIHFDRRLPAFTLFILRRLFCFGVVALLFRYFGGIILHIQDCLMCMSFGVY
jgi:hypothetical protein